MSETRSEPFQDSISPSVVTKPARWAALFVFVATFVTFLPTLTLDFVNWDDNDYIVKCPHVTGLTAENILFFISNFYLSNYHPLTSFSFLLDYSLWGLDPTGYHATSLLLHSINAVWVYGFALILVRRWRWAMLAALLYAIHPLRVETVAWVSARKDLLCVFFALPAMMVYLRYVRYGARRDYVLSLMLFIAATLSKSMAVTLPVVLLGLDWLQRRPLRPVVLIEKVPFFIVSATMSAVALLAQRSGGALRMDLVTDWITKLQTASYGFVFYLGKLLWPVDHSPLYAYDGYRDALLPPAAFFAPFALVAFIALWLYLLQRSRLWGFAIFAYLVMLLPVIQLIPIGSAYASDRYTYLPMIGICIALGATTGQFMERQRPFVRGVVVACLSIILGTLATLSWKYTLVWKNGETLWHHATIVTPRSFTAYNNLAFMKIVKGDIDEALPLLNRAATLNLLYLHPYFNRGTVYMKKKDFRRAADDFRRATEMDPENVASFRMLGEAMAGLGQYEEAIAALSKSISLAPSQATAYVSRAKVHWQQGHTLPALRDAFAALEINAGLPAYYDRLAKQHAREGRTNESEFMRYLALRYSPGAAEFVLDRAMKRIAAQDYPGAIRDFRFLDLRGQHSEALFVNWGRLHADLQQHEKAIAVLTRGLEEYTTSTMAIVNRGSSLGKIGRIAEAERDFARAIALDPRMVFAHKERGMMRLKLNNHAAALTDFDKAARLAPDDVYALAGRAKCHYLLKDYNAAWADVRRLRQMNASPNENFLRELRAASGISE